jgi:sugar phosphate isomerase/epimerase
MGNEGAPSLRAAAMRLTGFGDEVDPDPAVQIAVLQALGASAIDVRAAWGRNVVTLTDSDLVTLKSLCEDKGVRVSSVASPVGKSELSQHRDKETSRLERALHAARVLGADYVRLFSFYVAAGTWDTARPEVLSRIDGFTRQAEKAGKTLVLENEKGLYGDVPTRLFDIVNSIQSGALRIAWDPANFVQVGVAPMRDGYELLRPYIRYVHIKDARLADGTVTLPGQGDGDIPATLAALHRSGYDGFVSLEPHLMSASSMSGFSGAKAFGEAARALIGLAKEEGIILT